MSDDAQPQSDVPAQPAPTPATPAPVITPEIQKLLDERIAGVQSAFQKQLNKELAERDAQLAQLKTASMSEEEREQLAAKERDEELERLSTENWLLKQAQRSPRAAELYRRALAAEDHESAFALFEELAGTATPAPAAPEPEPADQVPDVDPNNPSALSFNEEHIVLPDGRVLTEAIADDILKSMTHWPTN